MVRSMYASVASNSSLNHLILQIWLYRNSIYSHIQSKLRTLWHAFNDDEAALAVLEGTGGGLELEGLPAVSVVMKY